MLKKAYTFNIVTILILTLIVIVIVWVLVGRSAGTYHKSVSCETAGGKCVTLTNCDGKPSSIPGCEKDKVCCVSEGG